MQDQGAMQLAGAHAETQYTSLHAVKFIGGLETQRSPFAAIDTRYGTRFFGGKPDTLIAGSNCEISNRLTLVRRPGLVPWSTASIPPPLTFYGWQQTTPPNISLMVDTAGDIYVYSSTYAGIYLAKAGNAGQTSFYGLFNTLYFGDGVDQYKIAGSNLLTASNNFLNPAWYFAAGTLTPGYADPTGGTAATLATWTNPIPFPVEQLHVTPNYTPVAGNYFTFSIWVQSLSGSESFELFISNNLATTIGSLTATATPTWQRFQLTVQFPLGDIGPIGVSVGTAAGIGSTLTLYGAQLEVGGPATPVQITGTQPGGVYLWGIVAPSVAPTFTTFPFGARWASATGFPLGSTIVDSNGNLQTVTATSGGDTSGSSTPTWATALGETTADNDLTWTNEGPGGVTATVGYQYYFAYENSVTGNLSSVSPISANTGIITGQSVALTGPQSYDPQVDTVVIFRNDDGGAFFYQVGTVPNPTGLYTPWTFIDSDPDIELDTSLFAPVANLNNPPPAGIINLEFHAGRLWGSVGSTLYYATSNDNAAQLNVTFNGVSAECWSPLNYIPFDAPIRRIVSTSSGLLVWTVKDLWIVAGQDLSSFYPTKILNGHGLQSWNALDIDGSTIFAYLSDRQFVSIDPSSGSLELGFPIGDQLETTFDPSLVYVARHVAGTQDNACYLANGSTGWYRLNPNQVGASLSGEQSPVWSPFATITGGCGAVASIQTSPGVHQLLVGQTVTGPVLTRSITTFSDNGTPYTWFGTVGSIVLTPAGQLAVTESITADSLAAIPGVAVLLDEISGTFETLPNSVNDPPQLVPSTSLNSNRWYLSQGEDPPLCKHIQIRFSGVAAATADEILTLTIRGVLVPEQT